MSSQRHPETSPQSGQVSDERTVQEPLDTEPALAHSEQRQGESIGQPERSEDTGTRRTEAGVSDAQAEHKSAQAAASGGATSEPSAKPGHEPSKTNGKG